MMIDRTSRPAFNFTLVAGALTASTQAQAHPGHGPAEPVHPHGDSVWIGLLFAVVVLVGLAMGTRR